MRHGARDLPNDIVRIATAGSVDDGKSTLIGRLLVDTESIYDDQVNAAKNRSTGVGNESMALALLTDGLKAERDQGITIDVAYRYFTTDRRRFILADTPGHEQYTRNMATGASTADISMLVIDASRGISTQTKRHAFISSLMGVPRFLIAVNKMDLVNYSEERFEAIRAEFEEFANKLTIKELRFIPISALQGDNVVQPSAHMPWYSGETLLRYLDNVYVGGDRNQVDFRFPVQGVCRPTSDFRGYMGTIASGRIAVGDEVVVLPYNTRSRVRTIEAATLNADERQLEFASAGNAVTITLETELDISRGDMIVREMNIPKISSSLEAMIVWMDEQPLDLAKKYLVMHNCNLVRGTVSEIRYRVNVNTLHREEAQPLKLNEIGRVAMNCTSRLFLDSYRNNRGTGSFAVIDPETFNTVAGGMIVDRLPQSGQKKHGTSTEGGTLSPEENNLHLERSRVSRAEREIKCGAKAVTLWFTGLSGSGKSSIARELERKIFDFNLPVFLLDGDNLRHGLNSDLGFSPEDRKENIRRAAHVAKLLNDAGVTVLCAFVSPYAADREEASSIIGRENCFSVYVSADVATCEARDPHGLYAKARRGEIKNFTGISAPFEVPASPDLVLDTGKASLTESVFTAFEFFQNISEQQRNSLRSEVRKENTPSTGKDVAPGDAYFSSLQESSPEEPSSVAKKVKPSDFSSSN